VISTGTNRCASLPEAVRGQVERFNALPAVDQACSLEGLQREATLRYSADPKAADHEPLRELVRGRGRGR